MPLLISRNDGLNNFLADYHYVFTTFFNIDKNRI